MPYVYVLLYAEATVLLVCACVPSLSPILEIIRGRVCPSRGTDQSHGNGRSSRSAKTLVTIGGGVWERNHVKSKFKKGGTQLDEEAIEMD